MITSASWNRLLYAHMCFYLTKGSISHKYWFCDICRIGPWVVTPIITSWVFSLPMGRWQILWITESVYFLKCVTIATTAAVAIDYGILSIVSPNLDSVVTKIEENILKHRWVIPRQSYAILFSSYMVEGTPACNSETVQWILLKFCMWYTCNKS